MVNAIKTELKSYSNAEKAAFFPYFFKTGKGEYGEGDKFIGVTVPNQRIVAKKYFQSISFNDLKEMLSSKIHEHRLCALIMLVYKFEKSKFNNEKEEIVEFYLKNKKFVNNWDLVDLSCYKILGRYCFDNQKDEVLIQLANEEDLWSKRIAIVSTMYHVKKGKFELTKTLVLKNFHHPHDLMHKANGWLLREMGKKNEEELLEFLKEYYHNMPRTCLRYSIEKLDEELRQDFLKGRI
jgi:3-methyladenine DNA glycosylase AlkD